MFKKEAKEYATDNYENCLYDDLPYANDSRAREQSFKDGAEFGYNKAKEDADKMKSQFLELCNLKDIRIAELEKANEWHYVKDGVFPEEGETVYCFCRGYCGASFCATARLYIGYDDKVRRWYTNAGEGKSEQLIDVIAWKEIVLPELKETDK